MEEEEIDPSNPIGLHLISSFIAMEPTNFLISLARELGGGSITKEVQRFIWEHCINKVVGKSCAPSHLYIKSFLKKVIVAVESSCHDVLDDLYEQYAYYITSFKEDSLLKGTTKVFKSISFLFHEGHSKNRKCLRPSKVIVPLKCSLNMFEGDTGCSIWPSSLFLSEFILSYPEIFSNKSCFEVGSGVGLVGISLTYVKASKVVLSDGDLSTLANMKLNLELNRVQLNAESQMPRTDFQDPNLVECKYLPWESAHEGELQDLRPNIVLGADVIYDPSCIPHLIRVLSSLLNPKKLDPHQSNSSYSNVGDTMKEGPVAYIATVIRNVDTFNHFLRLADQAHLSVVDITVARKPLNLLPYMLSYDRSSIRLYIVSFLCS